MAHDGEGFEKGLEFLREIAERLQGDLDEEEAISILEGVVEEVERLGEKLEEGGS